MDHLTLHDYISEEGADDSYLAHIFRNLHEAIIILDKNYRIAFWNHMAETMFGWNAVEVTGKPVEELLRPKFPDSVFDAEISRMLHEDLYEGMVDLRRKDGSDIYTIVHANVLRDGEGAVEEIIVSIWDSTERRNAHFALREAHSLMKQRNDEFHALIDNMAEELIMIEKGGGISFMTERIRAFFRGKASPVIRDFDRVVFRDMEGCVIPSDEMPYTRLLNGEKVGNCVICIKAPGGEKIYSVSGQPIFDTEGNVTKVIMLGHDITNCIKASEQASFRANLLSVVNEAIVAIDQNHIITYWNSAACELYGYTAQETVGHKLKEFQHDDSSGAPRYGAIRGMLTDNCWRGETEHYHKDGRRIWVEIYTRILSDQQGMFKGVITAIRDVTGRRKAMKDLDYGRRKLQAINGVYNKYVLCETLEQLGAACLDIAEEITGSRLSFVGDVDDGGIFHGVAASSKKRDNYNRMDMSAINRHFIDMPITGLLGDVLKSRKALLINDMHALPGIPQFPKAHERIKSFLAVPYVKDSKVYGLIAVANREGGYTEDEKDIMEAVAPTIFEVLLRKRAEEALEMSRRQALELVGELEAADRNKNEFLSTLSHELRNPLAVVSTGLQLLDMTEDRNKTRKFKDIMSHQVNQLCSLVDDLLDLTRIAHNKIVLKMEPVELNRLVLLAAEDIMPLFDQKGVKLKTKILKDALFADADPVRLKQIVVNLLSNALKFTDPGGHATLSINSDGGDAVICVKDTGIGIKPGELENMFKPFMQADSSLARPKGGLGLGLAIAKGIAELHGGTVYGESAGLGRGSSFYIRLPAAGYGQQRGTGGQEAGEYEKGWNILVIDDNRSFTEMLCSMLELSGHRAAAAYDGNEGFIRAKETKPDIIFCDIGLPGMNGYDFARAVRQEKGLEEIYLVAVTGYARSEDAEAAIEAGFDRHISKPVSNMGLKAVLRGVK